MVCWMKQLYSYIVCAALLLSPCSWNKVEVQHLIEIRAVLN